MRQLLPLTATMFVACASSPSRPGATPTGPRLAALDDDGVRLFALDTHGARLTGRAALSGIAQAAWRTRDELVVLTHDGNVRRVAPDGTFTAVPEPPPDAWPDVVFADVDDFEWTDVYRDDARATFELAVVDGAIWKARCAVAYWNDRVRCATLGWRRLDPPGEGGTRDPVVSQATWQRPLPVGFVLTLIDRAREADDDNRVFELEQALRCVEDGVDVTYPAETSPDLGLLTIDAPVGAGDHPALVRVPVIGPGEVGSPYDLLFERCGEPVDGDLQLINYGPEPWLAHRSPSEPRWTIRFDGAVVDEVAAERVVLSP